MTAFTPDAAGQLAGPDWLRNRRLAAAEQFVASGLPSPEEEIWRYSRVAELDLDQFERAPSEPAASDGGVEELLARYPDRAATLVSVDGVLVRAEVAGDERTAVVAGRLADRADGADVLGSVLDRPDGRVLGHERRVRARPARRRHRRRPNG